MSALEAQPRYIRAMKAPAYLGMDRELFRELVRPHLTEIPIGVQGIAFDRLELDAWADQYKSRYGRPSLRQEGNQKWRQEKRRGSFSGMGSGTLTSGASTRREDGFEKALAHVRSRKRSST